ncbi:hypothetical protein BC629DRAFT_1437038 [Irpex lacteus]|nr:hypothetical protein BC629DRAFT_1437038 [Irpex lacteus]
MQTYIWHILLFIATVMLLRPGISATNASPLSVQRSNTSADNTSAPTPSPSVPGPGNAFSGALNDGSFQRLYEIQSSTLLAPVYSPLERTFSMATLSAITTMMVIDRHTALDLLRNGGMIQWMWIPGNSDKDTLGSSQMPTLMIGVTVFWTVLQVACGSPVPSTCCDPEATGISKLASPFGGPVDRPNPEIFPFFYHLLFGTP